MAGHNTFLEYHLNEIIVIRHRSILFSNKLRKYTNKGKEIFIQEWYNQTTSATSFTTGCNPIVIYPFENKEPK